MRTCEVAFGHGEGVNKNSKKGKYISVQTGHSQDTPQNRVFVEICGLPVWWSARDFYDAFV